jgi:LemA protein
MGTAITVIIIILVIVVILALIGLGSYNGFVKSRNLIQESWRQIDVELNRRYELIPNLVETVRAYAAHERNTLEDVTRLRSQAQQLSQSEGALPSQQRADVEAQLSGAVRNLIVSVEAYPDLKSNQNFLELQRQLAETEDRIAAGRRFYNANVRVYNTKVESVPTNIIAVCSSSRKPPTSRSMSPPYVRRRMSISARSPTAASPSNINSRRNNRRRRSSSTDLTIRCPTRRSISSRRSRPALSRRSKAAISHLNRPALSRPQQGSYQPPQQGGYMRPRQVAKSQPAVAARGVLRARGDDLSAARGFRPDSLHIGIGCNNFGSRMAEEEVPRW